MKLLIWNVERKWVFMFMAIITMMMVYGHGIQLRRENIAELKKLNYQVASSRNDNTIAIDMIRVELAVLKDIKTAKQIPFWSIIKKHADEYGVDPYLIASICMIESSWRPYVKSKINKRDHRNGEGLMQLLPSTWKALEKKYKIRGSVWNISDNIKFGSLLVKELVRKHKGDIKLVLADYNGGGRQARRYYNKRAYKDVYVYVKRGLKQYAKYKKGVI